MALEFEYTSECSLTNKMRQFLKMQIKICKMQQKRLTLINETLDMIVIGIQAVI